MPGYIDRVAAAIAAILAREGLDYAQTKAVFKVARQKAGLKPPKEKRSAPARLSLEEELRFLDLYLEILLRKPRAPHTNCGQCRDFASRSLNSRLIES